MIKIDPNFYTSAPPSEGRLAKENRVYDMLDRLEVPYVRLDHQVTATIEECSEVEKLLEIQICKNLFLCTANQSEFYLLMMPGHKKFKTVEENRNL